MFVAEGVGALNVPLDLTAILAFLVVWYLLVRGWEASGRLDRWNARRMLGFVLMVRTSMGQRFLERMASPRRFWRWYGEACLWICWASMGIVGLFLLLAVVALITMPPQEATIPASQLLVVSVPGLSPVFPLGWGLFALIVTLVIHEFGHGLLARAHGMRVRSFGALVVGPLPLGAFAEPQAEELMRAPPRERQRIFAAGPGTNIFASMLLLLLLGFAGHHIVASDDGVYAQGIVVDSAAQEAGFGPYDVLQSIDGNVILDAASFSDLMQDYTAGQEVILTYLDHETGSEVTASATLGDKHAHYIESGASEEGLVAAGIEPGDAFLGVSGLTSTTQGIDRLVGPMDSSLDLTFGERLLRLPIQMLILISVPIDNGGISMLPEERSMLTSADTFVGNLFGIGGLMFLVNMAFWLIWLNILLGFTNLIPMVPFDGGHIFRDMVHGALTRIRSIGRRFGTRDLRPITIERLSSKASSLSSAILLVVLVAMVAIPYL